MNDIYKPYRQGHFNVRREKVDYPERSECDFTPDFMHSKPCLNCKTQIYVANAFVVKKDSGDTHFCGEHCAGEYYLECLRESGV